MVIKFANSNPVLFGNCLQDLRDQKEDLKRKLLTMMDFCIKFFFSSVTGTRRKVERHISCPLECTYDSHIQFLTTKLK